MLAEPEPSSFYETIQEVIAFPKTSAGKGLMDGCPSVADPASLEELGITVESGDG